jgi:hypothetical protein
MKHSVRPVVTSNQSHGDLIFANNSIFIPTKSRISQQTEIKLLPSFFLTIEIQGLSTYVGRCDVYPGHSQHTPSLSLSLTHINFVAQQCMSPISFSFSLTHTYTLWLSNIPLPNRCPAKLPSVRSLRIIFPRRECHPTDGRTFPGCLLRGSDRLATPKLRVESSSVHTNLKRK